MDDDGGAEMLVDCCCCMCRICVEACIVTDCCGAAHSAKCCRVVAALSFAAVAALVAVLVLAYAVVIPVRVTVDDASLGRLTLAFASANGTAALAYDVSLAVAVRNPNFAVGVWRTAPLDAELRFRGQTFARARLAPAESGRIPALGKAVYRVAASADSGAPVALGSDGVAEFVRESVAGVFELELAIIGEVKYEAHHQRRSVTATCPLKLSLSSMATAPAAFARVKCT